MDGIGARETEAAGDYVEGSLQSLILLRWVLIIAIAYLVMFSRPLADLPVPAAIFIALYLASNLLLPIWLNRVGWRSGHPEWLVVVLDVCAVSTAIALCSGGGSDLFVLYFVVLFLSALTDGVALAAAAAVIISVAHLITATRFVELAELIERGYMVRIPFLFAVAIFFGHLVQSARARTRRQRSEYLRTRRMEFLSTVSHDLRNPLAVIESLANLLLDGDAGPLNPDQNGLVRRIHASIRQVMNLSNNLMDTERIELGHFPLRRVRDDLRHVVEESMVLARTAAEIKGVSLLCELPPQPCLASFDPVQIERALSNLLGNAIKFTPRAGRVSIELAAGDEEITVAVRDSGPGVSSEVLRNLGAKYVDDSSRSGAGTGLGLYIASAIAEAHGGRMYAETSQHGSCFTLVLPSADDQRAPEVGTCDPALEPVAEVG